MRTAGERTGEETRELLHEYYTRLLQSFGPQGWWPARTRWEVICGAILTQNTTWVNTARAIKNLRTARALPRKKMLELPLEQLEALIRPAGFFRQKAKALYNIAQWIEREHGGSLDALFGQNADDARGQLLALKGIGPETADAILLYSGRHPMFVADAYTRRIFSRHGLLAETANYKSTQAFLHQHLPREERLFNEFHALIVETAKRYCHRSVANCEECPLGPLLSRNLKIEIRNSARQLESSAQSSVPVQG